MRSASAATRGRRRRRPLEEVHVDRVAAHDVLIDQHADALPRLQQPNHPADRALPVDDAVAGPGANPLEERVQQLVVERAGQDRHRRQPERVHHRLQLPEPEVPVTNSTPFPCA